jgi:membrane protease YdiL (CAAX protease family)
MNPDLPRHFLLRLRQTPLLAGWLILGPLLAWILDGRSGLLAGLLNLLLLGLYVLLIRWMTPNPAPDRPIRRPRAELLAGLALFSLFLVIQLLDFGVWTAQPWHGWTRNTFASLYRAVAGLPGIPDWALTDLYLAASSTVKKLIPTLLLFWLFGYTFNDMGFSRPHWRLGLLLAGLTALFGLATGILQRGPLGQVLALTLIGVFVNALPEELFFRGYLLPRLEKLCRNPLNALVISALLFNALHVPIQIHNGASPLTVILSIFSIGYPSGLIWGYLYLRTRSIVPGVLWHTANGNLGYILMSF